MKKTTTPANSNRCMSQENKRKKKKKRTFSHEPLYKLQLKKKKKKTNHIISNQDFVTLAWAFPFALPFFLSRFFKPTIPALHTSA